MTHKQTKALYHIHLATLMLATFAIVVFQIITK